MSRIKRVHAPGRVNLIGEHTDYTGGLVFPMAIDRGTTLTYTDLPGAIVLTSANATGPVSIATPFAGDPAAVAPHWGAFVAATADEIGATSGIRGHLVSDIPAGAGLSSSAALECVIALALGFDGSPLELSRAAQRAEHRATGVPTGIMDQLSITAAVAGHATMIDCHSFEVTRHVIPDEIEIIVKFIAHRTLEGSEYADRVAQCRRAELEIGLLRNADLEAVATITDDLTRRRARHVVSENGRVRLFAEALAAGDYSTAGQLMTEGHVSLRDDFDVSTPEMDAAVDAIIATPGVFGARMTGGGFGGCIVAIAAPGSVNDAWVVAPSDGLRRIS